MKILVDTNVLISALLYRTSKPSLALLHSAKYHELFLSDYNIAELHKIVGNKFPELQPDVDVLLAELAFEMIPAPQSPQKLIADPKDAPVLNAAILADVDIIISGDKHFLNMTIERPIVLTPTKYLEEYANLKNDRDQ